ncbi:MAG: cupin domain-containing protein [Lentisphaerales bacterium]|nr:cupin domain-containing protein [Lentisphaerales bacterium]
MNKEFISLPLDSTTQELIEESAGDSLLQVYSGKATDYSTNGTWFGFVAQGSVSLDTETAKFPLKQGMYFSCPNSMRLSGTGTCILISRLNWQGLFSLGGPIEKSGRLKYIDGCSDTLLIPPVEKGNACLNYLYFPCEIEQTLHTHPSVRVGLVYEGEGICRSSGKEIPLKPGSLFIIPAETEHAFSTKGNFMKVIAYHPDSDCGPTHDNHPMINKTIVKGTSARYLEEIQTAEL